MTASWRPSRPSATCHWGYQRRLLARVAPIEFLPNIESTWVSMAAGDIASQDDPVGRDNSVAWPAAPKLTSHMLGYEPAGRGCRCAVESIHPC